MSLRLTMISLLFGFGAMAQTTFKAAWTQFSAMPGIEGSGLGIQILDAQKASVFASNESALYMPASTLKALTALTALRSMGADKCFKTSLLTSGKIGPDGSLMGDLIVKAGGDPAFLSPRFRDQYPNLLENWVKLLKDAGIRRVNGNIIVEDRMFAGYPLAKGILAEDVGNYYSGGSFGFNISDNTYSVRFRTGSPDSKAEMLGNGSMDPTLSFTNTAVVNAINKDRAYIMSLPFDTDCFITGSLPANKEGFVLEGSYPDPARAFVHRFKKILTDNGIQVMGELKVERENEISSKANALTEVCSVSLQRLVKKTLEESINLYADVIARHTGLSLGGNGDLGLSMGLIRKYWRDQGIDPKGSEFEDGCGLSRLDLTSANFLASVLNAATAEEREMLCYGMKKIESKGKTLWYKTGYMEGVKALAGYRKDADGSWKSFAFIINHHQASPVTLEAAMIKVLMAD